MADSESKATLGGKGWRPLDTLSIGGWIILFIAVASTIAVTVWPEKEIEGVQVWVFARNHAELYDVLAQEYNADADAGDTSRLNITTIDNDALTRRVLSGFWSNTPLADLIEIERDKMTQFVTGPLEHVGFTDLTDRIMAEGLDKKINYPSFGPWTSRGRIFGLPHDVHPVLLCYRADLVEQAGIDVSEIETWDDFARVMKPLISDLDGDGRPDRYLLNLWYSQMGELEVLLLQAGGGTFDENDNSLVASDANVMVVAQSVAWMVGPERIAIDAPEFDASGNQLKLDGRVVAVVMPDWLAGVWKSDLSQLGGKLKLMPLPAWEPGGRRTSVRGGTMIGIPKATEDFETAWQIAKYLYISPELSERLFEASNIISPVTEFWDEDYYKQPDPFFSGQASGTAFIEQAPNVPFRSSNPFHVMARNRIADAVTDLYAEASGGNVVGPDGKKIPADEVTSDLLEDRARELLQAAEARLLKEMSRNVFLKRDREAEDE
ncbi:MAG: extracellular solute-binding protein [Planctomycetota bacterium]